ncbi:MAG: class I adenylate-forming enzyme family protein [Candidatus Geothermincolia bacterium]
MAKLVHEFLEESSRRLPGKVCLVHGGARYTYAEIDARANRLAQAFLDRGVVRGDRIGIFLNNSVEAVVSIFATLKAGAAFVPINPTVKQNKLEYLIGSCRPAVLVTLGSKLATALPACRGRVPLIVAVDPPSDTPDVTPFEDLVNHGSAAPQPPRSVTIDLDLAAVIYTSSSTGPAKGVMLAHLNMVSAADSITTYIGNTESDIILDTLPISFDYGLYQVLMAFRAGATVVLEKPLVYINEALDLIKLEKVTGLPGVPTFFSMLLSMKDLPRRDFSSLRYITNTAASLPVSHIRRLRQLFPNVRLFSMYGLTECKRVSFLPPELIDERPDSVGKAIPNEEVFIVDENGNRVGPHRVGELVVRGSNVMMGYWEMPEETDACLRPGRYPGERVLYTGDLFRTDDEGFLYFVGRKDDIIKSRGEKVSPREIESVIHGLRGVKEVAVVGVPDPVLGEAVKAFVNLEDGSPLTIEEILRYCAANLENVLMPKTIEIVETFSKTPTGKVDKKELRTRHPSPLRGERAG